MRLHAWWGREDIWTVRCFASRASRLAAVSEEVRHAMTGDIRQGEEWCTLCGHFERPGRPCLPGRRSPRA
ncbi:hypothetical protein [Actinomadura parmotrematis]|uniref:Uncharacterized protein n=1 Tax=Actinomadura parmotrematis TaxID=2864039 RepID=A0ABS7FR98_9ACTN|nr:hypothetical protein [Actinomadura parmotrematis]MBW8482067.1 hypothetical protein [Actinomadura parmotrematis]